MIRLLIISFIQWACSLAMCLPFFVIAARSAHLQGRNVKWQPLAQLAFFFLVCLVLTGLGPIWPFKKTLWQGMIFQAIWALVFVLAGHSRTRSGLTLRISSRAWRSSIVATFLLLLLVVVRRLAIGFTGLEAPEDGSLVPEFLLFQMTMPGIAEELSYRGVIQPRLNKMFGRLWTVLGTQVGWGWVITSVVFWAIHAFRIGPQMDVSFYWPTLTMQLVAGFVFGWLRERTGSVFPPMIAHNLVNVCWTLV